ncbi:MAG TPA: hypothetical protein PLH97_12070 [Verrucomicrobiota bacterium]|nr:hypothetical protein [Verrucomicrobiota bacterium]
MRSERNVALLAGCITAALLLSPSAPKVSAQEVPFFYTNPPAASVPPEPEDPSDAAKNARPSFWAAEMLKLTEAGIDDSLKYAFIDNTAGSFNLGADEIILLSKAGLSPDVISAMLQHDYELAMGLREPPPVTSPGRPRPIQIVLVPKEQLTNTTATSAVTASRTPKPKEEPLDPVMALATEIAATYEYPPPPEKQSKGYAIREPHPEKLLPPIIVIRSEGRVASIREYQIELEPESRHPTRE